MTNLTASLSAVNSDPKVDILTKLCFLLRHITGAWFDNINIPVCDCIVNFLTHDMHLQNSMRTLVWLLDVSYHLEWLLLHLDKSLPSQICGTDLCWSTEALDWSIIYVLGLALSIQISDIMLVDDLIVARQGAKKVVLLSAKYRLVLSRLPIGSHQPIIDMIGLLVCLPPYYH